MPFETVPVPEPEEGPKRVIFTAEELSQLDRNRKWLAEQTGIEASRWTDSAVRQMAQVTPAPLLWKNRLMIMSPLAELGYSFFWQMLTGAVKYIGWHIDNSLFMTNSGQFLPDAHNTMIKAALEIPGWTHGVFLEHDHTFPSNMLEIMSEYDDPIVSGLYFNRMVESPEPVVYYWNSTRTAIARLQPFQMAPILEKRGIYTVDVVPVGCICIRRDVFENWPKDIPWFAAPTSPANGKQMSDDVFFCRHAQEQGYEIKVDTRIIPKHWGPLGVDERHYVAWVKAMRKEGKTEAVPEHVWEPEQGNIAVKNRPTVEVERVKVLDGVSIGSELMGIVSSESNGQVPVGGVQID
jgi:hypothetical protein